LPSATLYFLAAQPVHNAFHDRGRITKTPLLDADPASEGANRSMRVAIA